MASTLVAPGDRVAAGDLIASLDLESLQDAVDEAEQDLADAQQTLADDLEAQAAGTSVTALISTGAGSGAGGQGAALAAAVESGDDVGGPGKLQAHAGASDVTGRGGVSEA
ncbi:MAG: hypothetical protein ACTMIR_00455, partial [Cellulomonadaceae bacterium]